MYGQVYGARNPSLEEIDPAAWSVVYLNDTPMHDQVMLTLEIVSAVKTFDKVYERS